MPERRNVWWCGIIAMYQVKILKLISYLMACLFLSACAVPKALVPNVSFLKRAGHSSAIQDTPEAYAADDQSKVRHLYVTVTAGSIFAPNVSEAGILLQEGGETGPEDGYYGYGATAPNASLYIVGQITNRPGQDSYKIVLSDPDKPFYGSKVLNLNKSLTDATQLKTKLAFDYYRKIPNLVGARTQFVTLHVRNASGGAGFVDCGLYTNVEEIDADYLKNHGLNAGGALYQAKYFEFTQFKDASENQGEAGYDKENFENIIQVRANGDNTRFFQMLEDMDNTNLSNEGVFGRYFNRDNYLSWLAANVIMGNLDANARNFLLYSPPGALTWYLLPWDNATSFGYYRQEGSDGVELPPWRTGISNYWGSGVHKRFLADAKNVAALSDKIEEMKAMINPDNTLAMLKEYYSVAGKYIDQSPEQMEAEMNRIAQETQKNIDRYYSSLYLPMPVFTVGPLERDDEHCFTCQSGVSLAGGGVYYDFVLGFDPDFNQKIEQIEDSALNEFFVKRLPPGTYYYKIILKNDNGDTQLSFDRYVDSDKIYYGVRQVVIK